MYFFVFGHITSKYGGDYKMVNCSAMQCLHDGYFEVGIRKNLFLCHAGSFADFAVLYGSQTK